MPPLSPRHPPSVSLSASRLASVQEGDTEDEDEEDVDFAPVAAVDEQADDMIDDDADADEVIIPAGAGEAANGPGVEEPEEDQPRPKRRRVTSGGSD